ncbi:MAG TPA: TIGR00730 family Rossman fold protein [Acidimicrobiales bacterium]|nr:TIGR00730 family Rossman fold protein [Acidimicrobiales bacterium]
MAEDDIDQLVAEILAATGSRNRDVVRDILTTAAGLGSDDPGRLNLKIASAALQEMRAAFKVFGPYRTVPKVTVFGSARTLPTDPLYAQARDVAAALAAKGWMVITGAGPGIMAAGLEGAGREKSFGINIRLPFEQGANEFIADDPKLIEMRYFFTRKLMLMKESDGFVVLPGGFGTLDEGFELLTLLQTGKADPAPMVLLEVPDGTYWSSWQRFLLDEVAPRGLIDPDDHVLYRITDDVEDAAGEILGFYRNYHSRRFVGNRMVVRMHSAPSDADLAALNTEFADICTRGEIERTDPLKAEVTDNDHLDLARIVFRFDQIHNARLRMLIDHLNRMPTE